EEALGPVDRVRGAEPALPVPRRIPDRREAGEAQVRRRVDRRHPREEVRLARARRLSGVDVEDPDAEGAALSDELHPAADRHLTPVEEADAPGEERDERLVEADPAREVELVRPLEEEAPLLRKEEGEARQVDLPRVDLRLGEVGVERSDG